MSPTGKKVLYIQLSILLINSLTVQFGCLGIEVHIALELDADGSSGLVVELLPVELEFLGIAAGGDDFLDFRLESQVTFGIVFVVAYLDLGKVGFHSRDCLQELGVVGLGQSRVTQFGEHLELSLHIIRLVTAPVELLDVTGDLLHELGQFGGYLVLLLLVLIVYIGSIFPGSLRFDIGALGQFLIQILQIFLGRYFLLDQSLRELDNRNISITLRIDADLSIALTANVANRATNKSFMVSKFLTESKHYFGNFH